MVFVCDTAVLIAADRRDERITALTQTAAGADVDLVVPVGCVAQAWRDGARQATLARFLAGCVEFALDSHDAREIGSLLARSGTTDIVDASVVIAAAPDHVILTGDPDDLQRLVYAAGTQSRIQRF